MSFICGSCKIAQPVGTKPKKVTTEIRQVTYPPVKDKDSKVVRIPQGFETVKELDLCPVCSLKKYNPIVVGSKTVIEKDIYNNYER